MNKAYVKLYKKRSNLRPTRVLIYFCKIRVENMIIKVLLNGLTVKTLVTCIDLFDIVFCNVHNFDDVWEADLMDIQLLPPM